MQQLDLNIFDIRFQLRADYVDNDLKFFFSFCFIGVQQDLCEKYSRKIMKYEGQSLVI